MILCHIFLAIILMIIPFFVGAFLITKTFVESYLYGQVFLWAVFQALAVPMVLFRVPFGYSKFFRVYQSCLGFGFRVCR